MAKKNSVYLVSPLRTPIGSFGGSLKNHQATQLGTHIAKAVIERSKLEPDEIDQLIFGHARQAGCGPNPARQVAYAAGIPKERESYTLNQACNSGLKSIILAAQTIKEGEAEIILAGGMESMSNTPYLLPRARWGMRFGNDEVVDGMYRDGFNCPLSGLVMGETAENLADQFKLTRREQDEYAVRSQNRCEQAMKEGKFQKEIVPISLKKGNLFSEDEYPRKGVTVESLAKLKPVFRKDGTVHAGNASGITDGAAGLLVVNEKKLKKINTDTPKVRIVDATVVGVDPSIMGIGPVPAIRKLLTRTKMNLAEIDLIELNEAFAAQVISCDRELSFDPEKLNVNGGSIALGHPIGATGTRIVVTLMHEMARRKSRYGLATLCVSGGLGGALLLEGIY